MSVPKRKNNINVYGGKETYLGKELTDRRQQLLDNITKNDSYLPDSLLHDDLDMGMLDYVKKNFVVVSDGEKIPIIPKILTIQRWGEFSNNWEFSDDDGNMKLPFITVVRNPDVQPGTNPSLQRTIPDRRNFYYAAVKTWNGSQEGADIYKIPQPVPVDITFEVKIVCTKLRDLNRFNKIVLQKFSSRQSYTVVKGHYIPIILDQINDNSPIETLDGRRFYIQNYKFTMMGFLIDSEEFEVKPAISRFLLSSEFILPTTMEKRIESKAIDVIVATFVGDGTQTLFSVGESIKALFGVSINGLLQEFDVDYYHIAGTSRITFVTPPPQGSIVMIRYYRGKDNFFVDSTGKFLNVAYENYVYDGSSMTFTVNNFITDIISFDINGLLQIENDGYTISSSTTVTLLDTPVIGSKIGITYLY